MLAIRINLRRAVESAGVLDVPLRHISRVTKDDGGVYERLRALHRGEGLPKVRRLIERSTSSIPWTASGPREADEPPHPHREI